MEKPWKKHGENSMDSLENHGAWSWSKILWFSWGNYHAFHASMEQENCNSIPHESMESMDIKPWKTMESIEDTESMEYKIMENHGKHGNLQK